MITRNFTVEILFDNTNIFFRKILKRCVKSIRITKMSEKETFNNIEI